MKTRLAALGAALPLLLSGGCSVLPGESGTSVTVYSDRATSFYEGSHVLVMGIDVGTVDHVEIQGSRVKVEATVDPGVPLPADVKASIMPMNLVGERNLVLYPPYSPGRPKAGDGHVIEQADTTLPIETDEALAAFTEVLDAIDPLQARRVTQKAADAFTGNGQAFNEAIQQTGQATETLGGQADALAELAGNLSSLAQVVEGKEDTLGTMIEQLSAATEVFAAERDAIRQLVEGLVRLVRSGDVLLEKYQGTLADDVRVLTQVSLVVQGNSERLAELIDALPGVARAFLKSWNRKSHVAELQFAVDPSLRNLMAQLGMPEECLLPGPTFSNCPWEDKK